MPLFTTPGTEASKDYITHRERSNTITIITINQYTELQKVLKDNWDSIRTHVARGPV